MRDRDGGWCHRQPHRTTGRGGSFWGSQGHSGELGAQFKQCHSGSHGCSDPYSSSQRPFVSCRVTRIDERWRDKFLLAEDTINSYKLGPPRYFNSLSSRAVSLGNNIYPILTCPEMINGREIFPPHNLPVFKLKVRTELSSFAICIIHWINKDPGRYTALGAGCAAA